MAFRVWRDSMSNSMLDQYDIARRGYKEAEAPDLEYLPALVAEPPDIGVIGCCSETMQFLTAYLRAGYNITAICDANIENAKFFREKMFPSARALSDYRHVLDDPSIGVVTLSLPDDEAKKVVFACAEAGKHVLIQKYFIKSLDYGEDLAKFADEHKVKIAVNLDARWAPGWRYATQLVRQGYIGTVSTINGHAIWNHNWIKGTEMENYKYSLLYTFGFHWFDFANVIMDNCMANTVFSYACRALRQIVKPPLLTESVMCYPNAKAGMTLDGDANNFNMDRTVIMGDEGGVLCEGPDRHQQDLWFISRGKVYRPNLSGDWLPGGFHGALAELLRAVQEDREPENGLRSALNSLALCFAALASADTGMPIKPGTPGARKLI